MASSSREAAALSCSREPAGRDHGGVVGDHASFRSASRSSENMVFTTEICSRACWRAENSEKITASRKPPVEREARAGRCWRLCFRDPPKVLGRSNTRCLQCGEQEGRA
jgi:hypothetical protein